MKVIYKKLPSRRQKCIVTIGVFDGIHLGHQVILERIKKEAKKRGVFSLVITFDVSPRHFLSRCHFPNSWRSPGIFAGSITSLAQKTAFIKSLGIDYLWVLRTSRKLLELSARDFIEHIHKYFEVKKIVVGGDFRFGYAGRGNTGYLKALKSKYGFELAILRKRVKGRKVISSSIIRRLIREGELGKAKKLLGRNFSLEGKVSRGDGRGSKLGFPTANISAADYVVPREGVYAAYAVLENKVYLAAVNVGRKPTFKKVNRPALEAHIINFSQNILGKILKVIFLERVRNERRFTSPAELKEAIYKDIDQITAKYSIPCRKALQPVVR